MKLLLKWIIGACLMGVMLGAGWARAAETYAIDPDHSSITFRIKPLVDQVSEVLIAARGPHPDQGAAELKVVLEAQARVAAEDQAKTGEPVSA